MNVYISAKNIAGILARAAFLLDGYSRADVAQMEFQSGLRKLSLLLKDDSHQNGWRRFYRHKDGHLIVFLELNGCRGTTKLRLRTRCFDALCFGLTAVFLDFRRLLLDG